MRLTVSVIGLVFASACSGNSVTAPTPATPPAAATFAPRGAVHDTVGRPIAQARVEVIDGPHRGLVAFSNEEGAFEFPPVFTLGLTARASKAGYRDQTVAIRGPQNPGWFHLDSVNGSIDFSGSYTLTFTADSACSAIPGYARRRTYETAVSSSGGTILVALAGGGYGGTASGGYFNNVLYAGVFEDTLVLHMSDPPVLERFAQGSHLMIAGQARGSIGQLPATVPISGSFVYCAESTPGGEPGCAVTAARCESSKHQLSITRR